MMTSPIFDFLEKYKSGNAIRMHMPGHKGKGPLGLEALDLTEISGADSLFEACGIIAESEKNASDIFRASTFYSTEGSSLCIRAAIYLLKLCGAKKIFASRNAHRSFISACALNGIEPIWLYPNDKRFLSGRIDKETVERALENESEKCAVCLTSPDYLGNVCDIKGIASVCKKSNALLFVDNAHGAYLKFLSPSLHPIDLGADICCDSAHKTLPVLTGGAYLHISDKAESTLKDNAKNALALFGSTSPSYLILASLDKANEYLSNGYASRLKDFAGLIRDARNELTAFGYECVGDEPLKLVIKPKGYGYSGIELARILESNNIFCEFCDKDCLVLMLTPENTQEDIQKTLCVLLSLKRREPITEEAPSIPECVRTMSLRDAIFAQSESVDVEKSEGRTVSQFNIACPPAVPVAVLGERINADAIKCLKYYGIESISVVKE